jgi:hypothetical protein
MKKLDPLQKISFVLSLRHIELHIYCAKKTRIKIVAEKLKQNPEACNHINSCGSHYPKGEE